MKFSAATLLLLTAPFLVSADWIYKKGDKTHRGGGSTKCNDDKLEQGTDWAWENKGGDSCQLFMYGDHACTGKDGLNFKTRGDKDHGNAQTHHIAWRVQC